MALTVPFSVAEVVVIVVAAALVAVGGACGMFITFDSSDVLLTLQDERMMPRSPIKQMRFDFQSLPPPGWSVSGVMSVTVITT